MTESNQRVVNKAKSELLPCPFCGERAEAGNYNMSGWQVLCVTDDCFAGGLSEDGYDSRSDAIRAWNTRA